MYIEPPARGVIALLALLAGSLSPDSADARTWRVTVDGSGDAPTIQAAIDSVSPGDEIVVAPGQYTWANQGGDLDYGMIVIPGTKQYFTLRSESGPGVTVLDAQRHSRVVFIQGFNYMTLEGFTITNGVAPAVGSYVGGGIACHLSHDVIRDCVIRGNSADQGGGLWCGGVSTLLVDNCRFRDNTATAGAGLFFINSSSVNTIQNSVIEFNRASLRGGGIYVVHDGVQISHTIIAGNRAEESAGGFGGRDMWPSSLVNVTVAENWATLGGGIYLLACPSVAVDHSIVAYSLQGPGMETGSGSVITLSCSDVYGNGGGDALPSGTVDAGGNFSLAPAFCSGFGTYDYRLDASSPCAPGNHPAGAACDVIGAEAVACGMVGVQPTTWGHVKAQYAH